MMIPEQRQHLRYMLSNPENTLTDLLNTIVMMMRQDGGESEAGAVDASNRSADMKELIERLRNATVPDRELDKAIFEATELGAQFDAHHAASWFCSLAFDYGFNTKDNHSFFCGPIPRYTGSIDAALTLVPDGQDWHIEFCDGSGLAAIGERIDIAFEPHRHAAIALCIAALLAIEATDRTPPTGSAPKDSGGQV